MLVAVETHAEIEQTVEEDGSVIERRIVAMFEELKRSAIREEKLEQLEAQLERIAMDSDQVSMSSGSIYTIFICRSASELQQLRNHFESELLKEVLEQIFTLLAGINEHIFIKYYKWDQGMFNKCLQQLIGYF